MAGLLTLLLAPQCSGSGCRTGYTNKAQYYHTNCNLTDVPTNISKHASQVDLGNNDITDIQTAAFSHLTQFDGLWMYENKLTHLKMGMFVGLKSLGKLNLHDNEIAEIDTRTFAPLKKLFGLWLYENKLTMIRAGMFKGLDSLIILG